MVQGLKLGFKDYRRSVGVMEEKMETTTVYKTGFRAQGLRFQFRA